MKREIYIFIFIIISFSTNINANTEYEKDIIKNWPELKSVKSFYGGPIVFYNKKYFKEDIVKNKDEYTTQIGKIRLNEKSKEFLLTCSPGRSHDPHTVFETTINNKKIKNLIYSYYIIIPGDGFVYTIKSGIGYFTDFRKYKFKNNKFVEIAQPFQYMGIESIAKTDFKIYYEKEEKNLVCKINKNEKVLIIGGLYDVKSNNVYFLLKNRFGLTGWHKLIIFDVHNTSLEGIIGSSD